MDSGLVSALLRHVLRCAREGEAETLQRIGFGPRELCALRELGVADLHRIEALESHFLDIRLEVDAFWAILDQLRAMRAQDELRADLIVADAPFDMMQGFFGMGAREYRRVRQTLVERPLVGRRGEPDEPTARALWWAISKRFNSGREPPLPARECLEVSRETGASLRAVWKLARSWQGKD